MPRDREYITPRSAPGSPDGADPAAENVTAAMFLALVVYVVLLAFGTSASMRVLGKDVQLADAFFVPVVIALAWIARRSVGQVSLPRATLAGCAMLVLLVVLLAATAASPDPRLGIVEVAGVLYLMLMYLWVSRTPLGEARTAIVAHAWLMTSAVLCVVTLGGFVAQSFFGSTNALVNYSPQMSTVIPFARLAATFPTMNMFASFLHVSVVCLAIAAAGGGRRVVYVLLGCLLAVSLVLTGSRNLLGVLVTLSLLFLPFRRRVWAAVAGSLAVGATAVLACAVVVTTVWCIFPVRTALDPETKRLEVSVNTAPSLYRVVDGMALTFVREHPVLGLGPGMFNRTMLERVNWNDVKDTYLAKGIPNTHAWLDPHNTYLGGAAEAGVLAAIAILLSFGGVAWALWRRSGARWDDHQSRVAFACACGVIGFLVNGLYMDILTSRYLWFMMGLGMSVASGGRPGSAPLAPRDESVREPSRG